jgi:hypothetical protein
MTNWNFCRTPPTKLRNAIDEAVFPPVEPSALSLIRL